MLESVAEILRATYCELLLDLHNLYANALNFGYAPLDFLARIPMECIRTIHLAGGKWIGHHQERYWFLLDRNLPQQLEIAQHLAGAEHHTA